MKTRWLTLIIVAAPFAVLLTSCSTVSLYNNYRLSNLERRIENLPHPVQTTFIGQTSECGLFGNGNHCDFMVAQLRQANKNVKSASSAYANLRVKVPNAERDESQGVINGRQPVEIKVLPSPLPANYRWEYGGLESWNLSQFVGKKNLYLVFVLNSGPSYSWETFFDRRCI